ncbi:histidinol dehydrogenase [Microbacterium lushaniae]|uniref:histidinol dehydrogenase n=1 Tax=Microbacterium lushaniae TaxID=2614639 RepID=UPI001CD6C991|nr:histidinol dehydrogenase [Microbacterium lushaniae]
MTSPAFPVLAARVLTWMLSLVIGAVYGTAATVAHAYTVAGLPLGLVLAIVGTGALLVAFRTLTGDRWTALAGGLGVVGATLLFSNVGPGGSAIVAPASPATEWIPLTWTLAVPLLVAVVVAWPDLSHLRAEEPPPPASPRRLDP